MDYPIDIPAREISGDSVFWHFFQYNPTPMWVFDTATLCFLRVNYAAVLQYGYTEEEFLNMTIRDIRPKEEISQLEEYVKRDNNSFRESRAWQHLKKDGTPVWAGITSSVVLYNGKKAKMVTANDVTETISQSVALAGANRELEKLSLVARLTGNVVMILNAARQIVWVNSAFTTLTGYGFAEAQGKRPSDLLHGPGSSEETTLRIQAAIDCKKPFTEEIVHYTKSGRKHWILADGQPVPANETGAAEYVIVETEITQLKEQEAAIQASEKQMNAFFTGTASLHILFDTHLRIVTFNKVAEQAIEKYMKKKLVVGESMLAVVSDSTRERFLHFALEAINGRPTINREAEIPLGSGEEPLWWVISDIPAYDSFGKIMGVAFTAFDITERKRAEEKIKRQNRLIRELAWRQSHLVRVPLANILSLAELLQTERNDRELLYALDEEAKRLDKVICDVVRKTVAS